MRIAFSPSRLIFSLRRSMGRVIIRKTPKGVAERNARLRHCFFRQRRGSLPPAGGIGVRGIPCKRQKCTFLRCLQKQRPEDWRTTPRFRGTKSRLFEEAPKKKNNDGASEAGSPEQTADMGEKSACGAKSLAKRAIRMETER